MTKIFMFIMLLTPLMSLAENSGDHNVLRVEVGDDGFNLYSSNTDFGAAACVGGGVSTVNNAVSFKQADFPNGYSHMLSTALAAFMGGKKVSMWYVGCQTSPWGNGDMPMPATLVVK